MSKNGFKHILSVLPRWSLTIVGLAAILWLTLAPHPLGAEELPLFPGADKIAHGLMFGGFTLLILLDVSRNRNWKPFGNSTVFLAGLVASSLGVIVEIAQWKMDLGRSFEWLDIVADISGVILLCMLWIWFSHYLFRH